VQSQHRGRHRKSRSCILLWTTNKHPFRLPLGSVNVDARERNDSLSKLPSSRINLSTLLGRAMRVFMNATPVLLASPLALFATPFLLTSPPGDETIGGGTSVNNTFTSFAESQPQPFGAWKRRRMRAATCCTSMRDCSQRCVYLLLQRTSTRVDERNTKINSKVRIHGAIFRQERKKPRDGTRIARRYSNGRSKSE